MPIRSFHDTKGREWQFVITIGAADRILAATSEFDLPIDLLAPTAEIFADLYTKQKVYLTAMWCLLLPKAQEIAVSVEEFRDSLDPPTIHAAKGAFWGAVIDFFPDQATSLRTLSETHQEMCVEVANRMRGVTDRKKRMLLTAFDRNLAAEMDLLEKEAAKTEADEPASPSNESPSSSESTGEPSPSVS